MQVNMDCLKNSGVTFEKMNATGGGARSKVWMQMKADVLNMPITALATIDAGTVGSAMLTGIVTGCFKDLEDAQKSFRQFAQLSTGGVLANGDDPNVRKTLEDMDYVSFGFADKKDFGRAVESLGKSAKINGIFKEYEKETGIKTKKHTIYSVNEEQRIIIDIEYA